MTNDFDLAQYLYEKTNPEDLPNLDRLHGRVWREGLAFTESPIEQILYVFLCIQKPEDMKIRLQQELKTKQGIRRVDFLIGLEGMRGDFRPMFIIEADGELNHTKPQDITHDKRRDRELLLAWGLPTIRFTGQEIMSDPESRRIYVHSLFQRGKQYE